MNETDFYKKFLVPGQSRLKIRFLKKYISYYLLKYKYMLCVNMHNSTKFLGVPCSQGYRWTIIFRVCNNLLSIFNLKCAITKRSIFNLAILGKVCLYRVYLTQHKNNFIICFYKGLKRAIDNAMTFYGFNAKLIRYFKESGRIRRRFGRNVGI